MSRLAAIGALLLVALLPACAFWQRTGAKKDAEEARRESSVEGRGAQDAGLPRGAPIVELGPDGFGETRLARAGSIVAEGLVLAVLAAAVTGVVRLYQRRLSLLALLASVVALLLAALAFLKAWG